jgi:hypothetical protein
MDGAIHQGKYWREGFGGFHVDTTMFWIKHAVCTAVTGLGRLNDPLSPLRENASVLDRKPSPRKEALGRWEVAGGRSRRALCHLAISSVFPPQLPEAAAMPQSTGLLSRPDPPAMEECGLVAWEAGARSVPNKCRGSARFGRGQAWEPIEALGFGAKICKQLTGMAPQPTKAAAPGHLLASASTAARAAAAHSIPVRSHPAARHVISAAPQGSVPSAGRQTATRPRDAHGG